MSRWQIADGDYYTKYHNYENYLRANAQKLGLSDAQVKEQLGRYSNGLQQKLQYEPQKLQVGKEVAKNPAAYGINNITTELGNAQNKLEIIKKDLGNGATSTTYFGTPEQLRNAAPTGNIAPKTGSSPAQSSAISPSRNADEYANMLKQGQIEKQNEAADLKKRQQKVEQEIAKKETKLKKTPEDKTLQKEIEALKAENKQLKQEISSLKQEIKNLKTQAEAVKTQPEAPKPTAEKPAVTQPEAPKPTAEKPATAQPEAPKPGVKPAGEEAVEALGVKKGAEEAAEQAGAKKPYVKPEVKPAGEEAVEALGVKKGAEEAAEQAGKSKGIWSKIGNAMKGKKGKAALVLGAAALVAGAVAMCTGGDKDEKPVETPVADTETQPETPAEETPETPAVPAPVEPEKPEEPEEPEEPAKPAEGEKEPEATVQNGDTIESVAERLGCTVEELRELNADKIKKFKTESGKEIEGFLVGEELNLPEKHEKAEGLKTKEQAVKEYEEQLIATFDNIPQAMWNQVCTPEFRKKHKLGEYKEAA